MSFAVWKPREVAQHLEANHQLEEAVYTVKRMEQALEQIAQHSKDKFARNTAKWGLIESEVRPMEGLT